MSGAAEEAYRTGQHNPGHPLFLGGMDEPVVTQQRMVLKIIKVAGQGQTQRRKMHHGLDATDDFIDKGVVVQVTGALLDALRQSRSKACIHHTQVNASGAGQSPHVPAHYHHPLLRVA